MSDYYCEEHRYNPPLNSVLRFCPYCLGDKAPAPEANSTSESSLKFQDGICHDCESPDLCIQDNGCHNTGKVFSQNDRPTCEAALSDQWKPIETYPKNGKEFMCIDTSGNIDIQWHPMVPAPEDYTHWMPLPAPPMSDK